MKKFFSFVAAVAVAATSITSLASYYDTSTDYSSEAKSLFDVPKNDAVGVKLDITSYGLVPAGSIPTTYLNHPASAPMTVYQSATNNTFRSKATLDMVNVAKEWDAFLKKVAGTDAAKRGLAIMGTTLSGSFTLEITADDTQITNPDIEGGTTPWASIYAWPKTIDLDGNGTDETGVDDFFTEAAGMPVYNPVTRTLKITMEIAPGVTTAKFDDYFTKVLAAAATPSTTDDDALKFVFDLLTDNIVDTSVAGTYSVSGKFGGSVTITPNGTTYNYANDGANVQSTVYFGDYDASTVYNSTNIVPPYTPVTDTEYVRILTPSSGGGGGGGGTTTYKSGAEETEGGDVELSATRVPKGTKVTVKVKPEEGYEIESVTATDKEGNPVPLTQNPDGTYSYDQPASDVTVTPVFRPIGGPTVTPTPEPQTGGTSSGANLEYDKHYAYIIGYPIEDTELAEVRPLNNITRAEVATIFFRMLTDESRAKFWTQDNSFPDVSIDEWFNNAISTVENAGIVNGYEDGTFRPNGNITRAEFAAIASRFSSIVYTGDGQFSDISGHWAESAINNAAATGWVNGYEDGTFRPDRYITRAEAITLINRILYRLVEDDGLLDNMIRWSDNKAGAWYFAAVQEATNSHNYEREAIGELETWTELIEPRDWEALEKSYSKVTDAGYEESVFSTATIGE